VFMPLHCVINFIMNNNLLYTPDNILSIGLALAGFTEDCQQVCRDTSLTRFPSLYGSNPIVYSELCEDLQTTNIPEAHVDDMKIKYFLMSIHFLKCYPTAEHQSALFKTDGKLRASGQDFISTGLPD
jgi:hypothetical protein